MLKGNFKNKIHTSHLALHTSNNGITLIALIITIIVMLILTGVTLSITLGDNGLVNKAKEATEATELAMDRELLLSAVVGAIGLDGAVDYSVLDSKLPEGFTGSNGTYTSENGNSFIVNSNGSITANGTGGNNDVDTSKDLELLQRYFLGEIDETTGERPGKVLTDLITNPEIFEEDEPDFSQITFKDNEVITDANSSIIMNALGGAYGEFDDEWFTMVYFKYNNNDYAVRTDGDFLTNRVESIKVATDIDFYGTYYGNPSDKCNGTLIIEKDKISLCDNNEEPREFLNNKLLVDETNQIVVITQLALTAEYKLIYENNQIINRMLRCGDYGWMLQNTNGLEAGLDGIYMREYDGQGNTYRLVFDSTSHTVDNEYGSGDSWSFNSGYGENMFYFKYNGVYYIEGWAVEVSDDFSQIVYNGHTYTKQITNE